MIEKLKDFIVVTGHYGCGKTNFTINLALDFVKAGRKVTVVDMDLINPYFRTSDFKGILEEKGVEVITPVFGATNLDIPSLPASMYGIFEKKDVVIIDNSVLYLLYYRLSFLDFYPYTYIYTIETKNATFLKSYFP